MEGRVRGSRALPTPGTGTYSRYKSPCSMNPFKINSYLNHLKGEPDELVKRVPDSPGYQKPA